MSRATGHPNDPIFGLLRALSNVHSPLRRIPHRTRMSLKCLPQNHIVSHSWRQGTVTANTCLAFSIGYDTWRIGVGEVGSYSQTRKGVHGLHLGLH